MTSPLSKPTGMRLNQAVASAVVRRHKSMLGRGPTKAQAFFRHNYIVVVLHDTLSAAEQTLVAGGEGEAVLDMRRRCQRLMRDELVSAVEELTDCKVDAFMSGNHIEPDMAVEVFVLDRLVPGDLSDPSDPTAG